jgi:hypothetical protein
VSMKQSKYSDEEKLKILPKKYRQEIFQPRQKIIIFLMSQFIRGRRNSIKTNQPKTFIKRLND